MVRNAFLNRACYQATFPEKVQRSKPAQNGREGGPELSRHLSLTCKKGQVKFIQQAAQPPSALPAPGFLGDVVNEGPTAEAQLIASLGFVVIQSFHGSLRLSGKTRRRRSGWETEADRHLPWFSLGNRRFQPKGYSAICWQRAGTAFKGAPKAAREWGWGLAQGQPAVKQLSSEINPLMP